VTARIGKGRKTPSDGLSMSVDVGKLHIKTSIDNNTIDGKMLRYHDFELVPLNP
jgi:hypothetical protein